MLKRGMHDLRRDGSCNCGSPAGDVAKRARAEHVAAVDIAVEALNDDKLRVDRAINEAKTNLYQINREFGNQ